MAELVSSEFFEQGDIERQELNITPIVSKACVSLYIQEMVYKLVCKFKEDLVILKSLWNLSVIICDVVILQELKKYHKCKW